MPNTYGNRIKVSTSTTGTGTITLGSAVEGFQNFSSGGITDGDTVAYVIEDGANFEIGTGTYTASGTTLTRTVSESTNSNSAISLSGDAVVFVAPSASDLPFTDGATFSGAVTFAEDVTFDGATAGRDIVFDRSDNALEFADNARLKLGDLGDLQLYHDGSHSYLVDAGTGDLRIQGSTINIVNGNLASMAKLINGGAVELYHNASKKIETTSGGIDVTGTVTDDGAVHDGDVTFTGTSYSATWDKSENHLKFNDNAMLRLGNASDLELYHNGSNSVIGNYTGTFFLVQYADDGDIVLRSDNGSGGVSDYFRGDGSTGEAILYHYGSEKLATKSTGVDVTGNITVSGTVDGRDVATDGTKLDGIEASADVTDATNVSAAGAAMLTGATFTGTVKLNDSVRLDLGTDSDLQMKHGGTFGDIKNTNGNFYIGNSSAQDDFQFRMQTAGSYAVFMKGEGLSGSAIMYHVDTGSGGASEKLKTTSTGVTVTGNIVVSGTVDGVDIATNIPSSLGTAGQVLTVNAGATAGEWASVSADLVNDTTPQLGGDLASNGFDIIFADNDKAIFGTGSDLQISHGGVFSNIIDSSNALYLQSAAVRFANAGATEIFATMDSTNGVKLNFGGSQKFQTKSSGVEVTGQLDVGDITLNSTTVSISGIGIIDASIDLILDADSGEIKLRDGGSHFGSLKNNSLDFEIRSIASNADMKFIGSDNFVEVTALRFDMSAAGEAYFNAGIHIPDSYKAYFGTGDDLQIYHNGTDSYIDDQGTGGLYVRSNSLVLSGTNGQHFFSGTQLGAAKMFYAGAQKLETTSTGIKTTGAINVNNAYTLPISDGTNGQALITNGSGTLSFGSAGSSSNVGTGNYIGGSGAGAALEASGTNNTLLGQSAGAAITTGDHNTAVGLNTIDALTTGSYNTALGSRALSAITTASSNTAVGYGALQYNETSGANVAVGYGAAFYSTGSNNTIVGMNALNGVSGSTTGGQNTAVGYQALYDATTAQNNTAVGYRATYNITTGYSNVSMGRQSLENLTTGYQNIAIGQSAGDTITTGANNIVIGYDAISTSATVSNEITLGNSSITRFRIPGSGIDNTSAALSGSGTVAINTSERDTYTHTLSANTTYTFNNVAASPQVAAFTLIVTMPSTAYTITWPTSVDWQGGTAPSHNASSTNVYTFISYNGGTLWYGFLSGEAMA